MQLVKVLFAKMAYCVRIVKFLNYVLMERRRRRSHGLNGQKENVYYSVHRVFKSIPQ